MEPKETIAVLTGKLSDPNSHNRYSAALYLINPAEQGTDISIAMGGLIRLLNDPDAKCVFMSSQAITAFAKAGGDIGIALDPLWSIIQGRRHAPMDNYLDSASRFAWKSHKYAAKNPATRERVFARADAALRDPDPDFVYKAAEFAAHLAASKVDFSILEPALADVISTEFPPDKVYESIKVDSTFALCHIRDNGACLGISIAPLAKLFVTHLKDQIHENAEVALKGAIKDERSRAQAVGSIISAIRFSDDIIWSFYLKPLLIYASGHGAPFDLELIRRELKKKLGEAENANPHDMEKARSKIMEGYLEFAETAAMGKKRIFDDGEGLEGTIRPPKSASGSGNMFRSQTDPNPPANRPLAPRLVKGAG